MVDLLRRENLIVQLRMAMHRILYSIQLRSLTEIGPTHPVARKASSLYYDPPPLLRRAIERYEESMQIASERGAMGDLLLSRPDEVRKMGCEGGIDMFPWSLILVIKMACNSTSNLSR